MSKYGEPIWSLVLKTAKEVPSPFTAEAIVNKIHQTHPDIPAVSIRTYVTAMAPNHPSSTHYPLTRRNHGHFTYLGNGRYRLGSEQSIPPGPPQPQPPPNPITEKEAFLSKNRTIILHWLEENKEKIIEARRTYTWGNNTPLEAIEKRRKISQRIILSRIRNGGGIDLDTVNAVMDWGGMRPFPIQDPSEALRLTKEAFNILDSGDLKGAACVLLKVNDFGIASVSKLLGLSDGERYCIYDSRVGTALKTLQSGGERLIPAPTGRTRPGDAYPKMEWARHYERLIWALEVIRDQFNVDGYPFNITDIEMALFMMGK